MNRAAATDANLPSAAIIGWATLALAGFPLSAAERARITAAATEAQWMPDLAADDVRPFFTRLSVIATLTAALIQDTATS